jgi:hypothetical protein
MKNTKKTKILQKTTNKCAWLTPYLKVPFIDFTFFSFPLAVAAAELIPNN